MEQQDFHCMVTHSSILLQDALLWFLLGEGLPPCNANHQTHKTYPIQNALLHSLVGQQLPLCNANHHQSKYEDINTQQGDEVNSSTARIKKVYYSGRDIFSKCVLCYF
jgi:hypothetical protein